MAIHTMCPSVLINTTGSTASMNSSPVSSMLPTTSYVASKTIVSSVVPVPSIIVIGWLGCCILELHGLNNGLNMMDMGRNFLLVVLNYICYMVHLWLLY